jgi:hypothetical protein
MNDSDSFSYERFMSLTGSALVRYAEPFVNTRTHAIPDSVYDLLVCNLAKLDEAHTVYALEICMAIKPQEFASIVAGFLANTHYSICCTACRLLSRISPDLMPADLLSRIAATPVVDLFTTDVHSGNPIRLGTNKEFIRLVLAEFSDMPT